MKKTKGRNPKKQRKRLYQAADHVRYKLFAAPLSPELVASQGVKTLSVRSGDTVRIMRGDHKGFEGKITLVDRKKYFVYLEGLTREKVDGTAVFVPVHPSKVTITRLNLDDEWRKKIVARKKGAQQELKRKEISTDSLKEKSKNKPLTTGSSRKPQKTVRTEKKSKDSGVRKQRSSDLLAIDKGET